MFWSKSGEPVTSIYIKIYTEMVKDSPWTVYRVVIETPEIREVPRRLRCTIFQLGNDLQTSPIMSLEGSVTMFPI